MSVDGAAGTGRRPADAVWVDHWLPLSQTFVMNQVAAMRRWDPVTIGLSALPHGLPVVPDLAPSASSLPARALRRAVGARMYLPAYTALLRDRRVRILHAHFGPGGISLLPIARSMDLPFLVTFHGYDVTQLPQQAGSRGRRYRRHLRDVFDRADALIAVSRHVRRQLLDLGAPDRKIDVCYIGAPVPVDRPDVMAGKPPRTGITFVGRLVEKKGVDDLLSAVAQLPVGLRDTPVSILGSGPEWTHLQQLATTLGINARFYGAATPAGVAASLDTAAVFCGPSKTAADGDTEGLPTTLVEAAHHGATIVSTQHAGIPEFVRDGEQGLLVDEGDVASLSAALALVLTDRELARQLATSAMARARMCFDVRECTGHLESIYDRHAPGDGGLRET